MNQDKKANRSLMAQQAQLGTNLVAQSEERLRQKHQETIQREVDEVIRKMDDCQKTIRLAEVGLRFFQAQKDALTSGEFSFHPWQTKILYKDERLNRNYQEPANVESFKRG